MAGGTTIASEIDFSVFIQSDCVFERDRILLSHRLSAIESAAIVPMIMLVAFDVNITNNEMITNNNNEMRNDSKSRRPNSNAI